MPDITNDFDNNPNTDKRKQRDEEVNNDNIQPEQTKSEPELLDQTKSKEFSIPIFAKLYDRCNLKIDELNLKNDKLNAKAYDAVTGEKKRDLYHPDGREEDTVYITASKTRIIDIYNDLAAGYELDKRGNRVEKIEEPRSKAQVKPLISRSKIKQNADKIAHTHNEQRNNTKSKEQEL